MSASKLFSINDTAHVGKPQWSEADLRARQLALDTIDGIKERRQAAIDEINARQHPGIPEPNERDWTAEDKLTAEAYTVLEALLKGRHREAVLPLVLEAFPELWAREGAPN